LDSRTTEENEVRTKAAAASSTIEINRAPDQFNRDRIQHPGSFPFSHIGAHGTTLADVDASVGVV